ncbi:MAG: CDP-glycerol glycerophosphotransferase family protein [Desulfobulbaceae bacterium]|nr:CDP-glycerol glycerophosphotransferase family protein [Desulfobulbaceae bacterium]
MNIIIFISMYNEIDHIAPVAYKILCERPDSNIVFVNHNFDNTFSDDFRLNYLRTFADIHYIDAITIIKKSKKIFFIDLLANIYGKLRCRTIKRGKFYNALELDFDKLPLDMRKKSVFLFDPRNNTFLQQALRYGRRHKIPVGVYMHGLNVSANVFKTDYRSDMNEIYVKYQYLNDVDVFHVNNEFLKNRIAGVGVDPKKLEVIGSPRYAAEWSKKLGHITPACKLPDVDAKYVKIVLMLSKWKYNVWKEEVMRIIKLLTSIENVFLIVKPHTRGMKFPDQDKNDNLYIADTNDHSRRLIEWSDLLLFTTSSIFMEAILLDKPVLHLRCATSNKLQCHDIMKSWNVDSRDDLVEWVDTFSKNRNSRTFTKEERQQCLNLYVNDEDGQLLKRQVERIFAMPDELVS